MPKLVVRARNGKRSAGMNLCHFLSFSISICRFYTNMHMWLNSAYFRRIFRLVTVSVFLKRCRIKPACLLSISSVEKQQKNSLRPMVWYHKWTERRLPVNKTLVSDPYIGPLGFHFPGQLWSILEQFQTGQGQCSVNLHKWQIAYSENARVVSHRWCSTLWSHIHWPVTKLTDDALQRHSADIRDHSFPQKISVNSASHFTIILPLTTANHY